jgi:adenosine deaminase
VLPEPTELWVITTKGTRGTEDVEAWWNQLDRPVPLRWYRTTASDGQAQSEVELIRELILRVVLAAGPDAVLSLAGGRKTMSADLQWAGTVFGCRAMLHLLPPDERSQQNQLNLHDFNQPLPADLPIQAVIVGEGRRNDLLDIDPAIIPDDYPVSEGDFAPTDTWLWQTLAERERDGGQLLANFHTDIAQDETHENWRSLYRLPPAVIKRLREQKLTSAHREWLIQLPKAELHCHIGGILDLDEQIAVGQVVWEAVPENARAQARADAQDWLKKTDMVGDKRIDFLGDKQRRQRMSACLLAETEPKILQDALWPSGDRRVGLKASHRWEFGGYEHPGSLVGSAILQSTSATTAHVRLIKQRGRRDGLAYMEIRCSPNKYYPQFLADFYQALHAHHQDGDPIIRLIIIADRRRCDNISSVVNEALQAFKDYPNFLVGLDMAGDEQRGDPQELSEYFTSAFEACMRITIHAGEGESAENIWKSAYHLHADRIGHGLTLADAPDLAARFRDRRICLELCPTSNREVVGFYDPEYPGSQTPYPLRKLMQIGVPLTLCTDNPGISRTTLADEYLTAARMIDGGLSQWEALALIKQAFLHAFLPANEREKLIKDVDLKIFNLIQRKARVKEKHDDHTHSFN